VGEGGRREEVERKERKEKGSELISCSLWTIESRDGTLSCFCFLLFCNLRVALHVFHLFGIKIGASSNM
jgi:hypothetical protein